VRVSKYNYDAQFDGELENLVRDITGILTAGSYILSQPVEDFERQFADFLGVAHVIGTNSGTDALILGLMALGIGPGHRVITQANTFYATVAAIRLVGAVPVLVDADEDTFLIDSSAVAAAMGSGVTAIVPVHLYGKPTPMEPLQTLAKRYGAFLLEDAAQSHGARRDGRFAGANGDLGCFSFHPSKNLAAAGDAGAVVTNSSILADKLHVLRTLGQRRQNDHVAIGLNSKLDGIQARVLRSKLPKLLEWNKRRRVIAAQYRNELRELPVCFQATDEAEEHAFHLFQIRSKRRDALLQHLIDYGIDAVIRYPVPIHLQPAFADMGWRAGQFPIAEHLAKELLAVPIRPDMTEGEVLYVAEVIRAFFQGSKPPTSHPSAR
jgi:dTDP-4-amino-4,6-dideoxygalactose transaminase